MQYFEHLPVQSGRASTLQMAGASTEQGKALISLGCIGLGDCQRVRELRVAHVYVNAFIVIMESFFSHVYGKVARLVHLSFSLLASAGIHLGGPCGVPDIRIVSLLIHSNS